MDLPVVVSDDAYEHFTGHGGGKQRFRDALRQLLVLSRMAKAVARVDYELALPKIAMMFATLGYVVSPVDAVPEAILGPLGLGDDAALIGVTCAALAYEIANFLEWESTVGAA